MKHLIWSGLDPTYKCADFNMDKALKPLIGGYVVPHFDAKAEVSDALNAQTDMAVDFVFVGFYYDNWFGMKPNKGEDGNYALYLPLSDNPHYMVDVADTGRVAAPLFKRLPEFGGTSKMVGSGEPSWPIHGVIGDKLTGEEIAQAFSEVCLKGAQCTYVPVPVQGWIESGIKMGMPEPVVTDFGHMFAFFNTSTYISARQDAFETYGDRLTKFKPWLEKVKGMLFPDV